MKRFLTGLLSAVMIVGSMAVSSSASETDKCVYFDDLCLPSVGTVGYAANSEGYVKDIEGVTLAFDFNAIEGVKCSHQFDQDGYSHLSAMQILFSSAQGQEAFVYDFNKKGFGIYGVGWPTYGVNFESGANRIYAFTPFECKPGEWHRVVLNIWDIDVFVYVDGELILEYSFDGGDSGSITHPYLIFWSQHCRFAIDNILCAAPDPSVYDPANEDYTSEAVHSFSDCNDMYSYEYLGTTEEYPAKDGDGNLVTKTRDAFRRTTEQATDEEGNLKFEDDGITPVYKYYGNMKGAGFNFDNKRSYSAVDRNGFVNLTTAAEGAAITFADTQGKRSSDIKVEVTATADANGEYTVACHPYLTFKGVENVANGAKVDVSGNKITISGASAGKLCDFVFTTNADVQQDDLYAYGLLSASGKVVDAGKVTVVNFKYGDVNEDGKINGKDVASMLKHKAGFDVVFNEEASDVYSDGKFTARDITYLVRHLANWEGYEAIPSSAA